MSKSVLPQGSLRARIRATSREVRHARDGTLGDTLGEERLGMVIVDHLARPPPFANNAHHVIESCHALGVQDPDGHPMKYDQMSVFESIVAKQHVRIEIDVPGEGGRGWRRSASSFELDLQQDLGEAWRRDLQAGTAYMLQETLVKANDAHMDAKVVRETA